MGPVDPDRDVLAACSAPETGRLRWLSSAIGRSLGWRHGSTRT
jgi:hypothetical protein